MKSVSDIVAAGAFVCPVCGRVHSPGIGGCVIGEGASAKLPAVLDKLHVKRPFVICDENTYKAAKSTPVFTLGEVCCLTGDKIAPDEVSAGRILMKNPPALGRCDGIIGVGGGVINDLSKLISAAKNVPYVYLATAPSMDGYASATSSVDRDGLKVSLPTKSADVVVADLDIIAAAPKKLILAGIGDMLAKYISLAEWKIAHIILGEYYCPYVAELVSDSLDNVVKCAPLAVEGVKSAVGSVCEGLILAGMAMNFAGLSRPASGMEHYISHIIDMRALEFGTRSDLHGIQCGIATLYMLRLYEKAAAVLENGIDKDRAVSRAEEFDYTSYSREMKEKLGRGGEVMAALEAKEGKYDPDKHSRRLEVIIEKRKEILGVTRTLPKSEEICRFMKSIGHPVDFGEIGISADEAATAVKFSRDIRDKYVLGRLLWDVGADEILQQI